MKGYKAFEKGLICRGKQYAENTVFEEDDAVICEKGMHFCEDPLAVLDYYPLVDDNGNLTEFAEVESLDKPKTNDNQKFVSKKLKIGTKLDFVGLIKASVNFDFEKVERSKVQNTAKRNAKIGSSGYSAKIGSSGDSAQIGSSGDSAQIGSSGDFAKIGSSGYSAKIVSNGKYAVICCSGNNCIAKGKVGSWITLSEWAYSEKESGHIPICVKTERINGKKIKADTFYRLKNGEFVEVK